MRKLIILCIVCTSFAVGQKHEFARRNMDTLSNQVNYLAYAAVQTDTLAAVDVTDYKTFISTISAYDSCQIIRSYELSMDGVNWGTKTLIDSLVSVNDTYAMQVKDFSSIILGYRYIRFIISITNTQGKSGTTSAFYTIEYFIRQF